ncbi:glycosyltransferase family 4 protein [Wolinella succinogenes]|uniref:glycosyltransferase family 4 protein n=1 Tax=Wolinella succinogenes TaxID=844 RepID=UPI002FCBB44C
MTLGLFFTRGVSLKLWVDAGLYDREKLIYEEHLKQGNFEKVYWFTYDKADKQVAKNLKNEGRLHHDIEIFEMPPIFNVPKIGSWIYSLVLPFLYISKLKECDVLKTNQMDGSWSAVIAKWLLKKPLILRTGWTVTQFWRKENKSNFKIKLYELFERFGYSNANIYIVSSLHDKLYIESKYPVKNTVVIPNFINTSIFKDMKLKRYNNRLLFVGRLNSQKNLFNLIEAISKTKYELDIYGQGELKDELHNFALKLNVKVNFKGIVSNNDLVAIYNSYNYYILPSFFEGMPKTLLEAMACGCVCIGTNVSGINEVIYHNQNGILINGVDVDALFKTLKYLDNYDRALLSQRGMESIQKNYSFYSIVNQEKELINGLFE